jgi:phosphatidylinositol alpha-1,6-mannosyltransferase
MKNDKENNILLFTLEYPPYKGGIANYYANLVSCWPQGNIHVLTNGNYQEESNVHCRALISSYLRPKWLPAVWHLIRLIRKHDIKHVIVGHLLPLGTVAMLVSKILRIDYTIILHGMDISWSLKKKRKKQLTQKILTRAQYIISANHYTNELAKKEFPSITSTRMHVVNPGITNDPPAINNSQIKEMKQKYNLEGKFMLLSIGRSVARKGFQQVIKALPLAVKKNDDIVYVMAGDGPFEKDLKQQRERLPSFLQDRILFLGGIPEKEKWIWLAACDAFIMPSLDLDGDFEGFGIVYLEANIMGKPVIASQEGGVADAVEHENNGLIVDPRDPTDIADAITRLATSEKLRKKLGLQGKERAEKNFAWEGQVSKIYQIINHKKQK